MELIVYNAEIDPNPDSDLEVTFIGLVEKPAIERNFQAFNEHKKKAAFVLNEEKRIISGPAMIPGMPLYRKDDQLGEYYVVFGKDQIRTIAQKFHSKGYMKKFNLFHKESAQLSDVEIFSSFQSDSELGISPIKNFEDLADGTWFLSAKVTSDDTWGKVKDGTIKGFSVEGLFTYIPVAKVQMAKLMISNALTEDDQLFLMEMVEHHQEALQMSVLVDANSKLYDFAQNIIKTQSEEITQMKQWLTGMNVSIPAYRTDMERSVKRIEKIINRTELNNQHLLI